MNGEDKKDMYCLICDIDNCFTDSREWLKHVPEDNSRAGWDKFLEMSHLAKPNKRIIDLVISTIDLLPVFFLTGREDRKNNRKLTEEQIEVFSGGRIRVSGKNANAAVIMRQEFDYRPSAEVKEDMLKGLVANKWTPATAIDDEESNCQMFARYGIPVMKYDIETDNLEKVVLPELDCVSGKA